MFMFSRVYVAQHYVLIEWHLGLIVCRILQVASKCPDDDKALGICQGRKGSVQYNSGCGKEDRIFLTLQL